jgi:hypothetical protein
MPKIHRTAMGKVVDVEKLFLKNDTAIAIGNMKVNARGDELGRGGKVVKTKDQIMKEYYALKTPTAMDPPKHTAQADAPISAKSGLDESDFEEPQEAVVAPKPTAKPMRGTLASTVSKSKK